LEVKVNNGKSSGKIKSVQIGIDLRQKTFIEHQPKALFNSWTLDANKKKKHTSSLITSGFRK
jgi:hypothetical protein